LRQHPFETFRTKNKKKKISSYFGCQMISNQFHRIIFILSKIHLHTSIDHHLYMCVCVFIVSVFQLFINFWNLFFFLVLSTTNKKLTTTKKNYPPPSPGLILFWRYRFVIF
jgi:hypothetical protein